MPAQLDSLLSAPEQRLVRSAHATAAAAVLEAMPPTGLPAMASSRHTSATPAAAAEHAANSAWCHTPRQTMKQVALIAVWNASLVSMYQICTDSWQGEMEAHHSGLLGCNLVGHTGAALWRLRLRRCERRARRCHRVQCCPAWDQPSLLQAPDGLLLVICGHASIYSVAANLSDVCHWSTHVTGFSTCSHLVF